MNSMISMVMQDFLSCPGQLWSSLEADVSHGVYEYHKDTDKFHYIGMRSVLYEVACRAAVLKTLGLTQGELCLVCAETELQGLIHLLACLWLGAVPVAAPILAHLKTEGEFLAWFDSFPQEYKYVLCGKAEQYLLSKMAGDARVISLVELKHLELDVISLPVASPITKLQTLLAYFNKDAGLELESTDYNDFRAILRQKKQEVELAAAPVRFVCWSPLYSEPQILRELLAYLFLPQDLILVPSLEFRQSPLRFITRFSEEEDGCIYVSGVSAVGVQDVRPAEIKQLSRSFA